MATMVGSQVKLDNGQVITPQQGGWYDAQQFWGGTLSNAGQINSLSNQQGAGQDVSEEVNRQTSVAAGLAPNANQDYINSRLGITSTTTGGGATTTPTAQSTAVSDIDKQIADLQNTINTKKSEADKRRAEVNDNPFLSEASRVGRIAKIDMMLNDTLKTDEASLTSLTDLRNQKVEEAKVDTQVFEVPDDQGNMTYITVEKQSGKIIGQTKVSGVGKVTKDTTSAGASNNYRNIILDSARGTDEKYHTENGMLVENKATDDLGQPTPWQMIGDKKLSRQELNYALDLAYANSGTKGGFTGTREEFAKIFKQVLDDNGYYTWGD
jgi:hypothetical protein